MSEKIYDYSKLDQPEVLQILFHPRREAENMPPPANVFDSGIPVAAGVRIHARFHLAGREEPNILFFHGNGEIVSDYDDVGPFYTKTGMNFLAVDYRGYGKSSGSPSVTSMLQDARGGAHRAAGDYGALPGSCCGPGTGFQPCR
jgi:alpha-beta hydrolase superfamily lysophospholipase